MAAGFFAGLLNWTWLGRRRGWGFNFCSDLLFWIMVAGILGARAAYVISDIGTFARQPWLIVRVDQGGLIYYGGFLGAGLGIALFARRRHLDPSELLDIVITAVPLGHAMGRIGCFLNGCCYGVSFEGAWAVRYPMGSSPWWDQVYAGALPDTAARSLPVHPVQLYEAFFNLILYGLLVLLYRRRPRPMTVTSVYLLCYPAGRFFFELLRGDPRLQWAGLTAAQWVSLFLIAVGAGLFARSRRKVAS